MAYPLRIYGQQMEGCTKAHIAFGTTGKLDDLRCNALPAQGPALNNVWRRNFYDRSGGIGCILWLACPGGAHRRVQSATRQLRAVHGIGWGVLD
jgi:hypothetical protein